MIVLHDLACQTPVYGSLTDHFMRLAFQAAQRDHLELLGALTRDQRAGNQMSEMLRIDRERHVAELRQWQIEQAREFDDTPRSEWPPDVARAWRNHAEELARHGAILDQLKPAIVRRSKAPAMARRISSPATDGVLIVVRLPAPKSPVACWAA